MSGIDNRKYWRTPHYSGTEDSSGNFIIINNVSGATILSVTSAGVFTWFGNLVPSADNTDALGTATLRWAIVHSLAYNVEHASADANPSAQLGDGFLALGVGGATALDTYLKRGAAQVWWVGDGTTFDNNTFIGDSSHRIQNIFAGPSGLNVFHGSGDANASAEFGDALVSFGAGGASALDTTISRAGASSLSMPNVGTDTGVTTAGKAGHPIVVSPGTFQKAETTAPDAAVLTYVPGATAQTLKVHVSCQVSSATNGVISFTLTYKNSNGTAKSAVTFSIYQQGTDAPARSFTSSSALDYTGEWVIDIDNSNTSVVVGWVGGGTTAAKVSAWIERVNG